MSGIIYHNIILLWFLLCFILNTAMVFLHLLSTLRLFFLLLALAFSFTLAMLAFLLALFLALFLAIFLDLTFTSIDLLVLCGRLAWLLRFLMDLFRGVLD